ncbi:hypothetical protein TNCV_1725121 [Trichonephila clavipes]|nr:hypothetical protein TNCV_1725121 [Trichonephila clavipes]
MQALSPLKSWPPLQSGGFGSIHYVTAIYLYAPQEDFFICHKKSPDNARSVAFSQLANSPSLIEDETFNDSDINNLMDYEDRQEDSDSLRADIQVLRANWKSTFL